MYDLFLIQLFLFMYLFLFVFLYLFLSLVHPGVIYRHVTNFNQIRQENECHVVDWPQIVP